jgi:hypothetical protein
MGRISIRLRDGEDDDIIDWYERQGKKSEAVRAAIRAYIRLQNEDVPSTPPDEQQSNHDLAWLPEAIAATVHEVLSSFSVQHPSQPTQSANETDDEDPIAGAQIDAQLDQWF